MLAEATAADGEGADEVRFPFGEGVAFPTFLDGPAGMLGVVGVVHATGNEGIDEGKICSCADVVTTVGQV
jgi:hypothetical protein